MRILLTSNASYHPPRGGSTRSNLVWLRHLAASGHYCRVISASLEDDFESMEAGVSIRGVKNLAQRASELLAEIRGYAPDWVLVSSEDLSHVLLREAGRAAPRRIVYLAHTPQFFPFGPESWNRDERATAIVRDARAVVAIGRHMAAYVAQHAGVQAAVIHPPIYGRAPFAKCGSFDAPLVLMINPCQVKGLSIFLELAKRFPALQFAALIGWGTTGADKDAIAGLVNVRLLASVANIEEALSQARVLLMPSLWYEGFGLIAMEAMLRGLPVIASDSGGLKEAKHGTGCVIPVRPVERYLADFDEVHMPKPVIPVQDIEPWVTALNTLTTNRAAWENESARSRSAGLRFVETLKAEDFETLLQSLEPGFEAPPPRPIDDLTASQRTLLLQRLMRQRGKL